MYVFLDIFFFGLSCLVDPVHSERLGLAKDPAFSPSRDNPDIFVMVWIGFVLRFWILSLYRLALEGERDAWRDRPSGYLCEVLSRPADGIGLGSEPGGLVCSASRACGAWRVGCSKPAGLATVSCGDWGQSLMDSRSIYSKSSTACCTFCAAVL